MNKDQVITMMDCNLDDNLSLDKSGIANIIGETSHNAVNSTQFACDDNSIKIFDDAANYTCWDYWRNDYYPHIIRESYPVYIQERAKDKGKQAFEIIKILKDKKLVQLKTVGDFIDLMDELIKIL